MLSDTINFFQKIAFSVCRLHYISIRSEAPAAAAVTTMVYTNRVNPLMGTSAPDS